jgi:transketolase
MRNAVVERLTELAENDDKLVLITGDLGFGVLEKFQKRFPKQFLNAGVAEQNMTAIAAGMALEGHIVFTYSIGNFPILRCLEQIRNDVCYHECNVNIISVGGGFSYGSLGMSHHATEDISVMRSLPNMTVLSPSEPWQAAQCIDEAINDPRPSYIRIDKSSGGISKESGQKFQLGKANIVRSGQDLTIIATGGILKEALEASDLLSKKGVECRVIDLGTIKPIDEMAIIAAAKETGGIITLEEHNKIGGLGSAVSDVCMDNGVLPKFFVKMGMNDVYSSVVGSQQYLRGHYELDSSAVVKQTLIALNK